jgi:hypothetical protein
MPVDLENDLQISLSDVARHIRTYGDELALSLGLTRAQLIAHCFVRQTGPGTLGVVATLSFACARLVKPTPATPHARTDWPSWSRARRVHLLQIDGPTTSTGRCDQGISL